MVQENKRNRFQDDPDDEPVKKAGLQETIMKAVPAVIISVVLMFAVLYVAIMPKYVTIADNKVNMEAIIADLATVKTAVANFPTSQANDVTSLKTQLSQLTDQLDTLDTSLGNLQKSMTNYVESSAFTTEINAIKTQITSLQSSITSPVAIGEIQADIANIQTVVEGLADRITTLETTPTPTVTPTPTTTPVTDPITVAIQQQAPYMYVSDNQSVAVMRVTIQNNTDKDVQDVVVGIGINLPAGTFMPTESKFQGGTAGWTLSPYNILYQVTAGWGYTIKANEKLTFEVVGKFNNIGSTQYTAQIYLEGWNYK